MTRSNKNKKIFFATAGLIALGAAGAGWFWHDAPVPAPVPATQVESASHDHDHDEAPKKPETAEKDDGHGHEEGGIELSAEQIADAGIGVETVSAGTLAGQLKVPAQVVTAENRRALVVPKVPGVVVKMHRNIGDTVRKGDTLAVVESRDMADAVAEYMAASSAMELARNVLAREKTLWDKKITAEQDYLNARNAAREADIRQELAAQKLRALGHDVRKTATPQDLRFHTLSAPIDGRVIAKDIVLGAQVEAGQAVYDIADTSVVWVDAAVPAGDGALLSEGLPVSVADGGRQATGRIIFASPVVDPSTRSIRAIAEIENADMFWRPGSFVELGIKIGAAAEGIVIPQAAIQSVEGKTVVFVRNEHGFETRAVKKGRDSGDRVEILSGLAAGEDIATVNSFVLKAELGKSEAGHEH